MKPSRQVNTLLLGHDQKALRLPTASADFEKAAKQRAAEETDHLGYVLTVCELELIERERKAAARRLKAASKVRAELLFDVISTSYKRTTLIVTTYLPFEQWPEVLDKERLTVPSWTR
jgi:DNA replication protein DnaC